MQQRLHGLLCVSLAGNDTIKGPRVKALLGSLLRGTLVALACIRSIWLVRDVGVCARVRRAD
jgi:hypothetical protein